MSTIMDRIRLSLPCVLNLPDPLWAMDQGVLHVRMMDDCVYSLNTKLDENDKPTILTWVRIDPKKELISQFVFMSYNAWGIWEVVTQGQLPAYLIEILPEESNERNGSAYAEREIPNTEGNLEAMAKFKASDIFRVEY
ncbi:MAG: hypothetical protein ABL876_00090 [Chitinophagaceae bacterium]